MKIVARLATALAVLALAAPALACDGAKSHTTTASAAAPAAKPVAKAAKKAKAEAAATTAATPGKASAAVAN